MMLIRKKMMGQRKIVMLGLKKMMLEQFTPFRVSTLLLIKSKFVSIKSRIFKNTLSKSK